MRRSSQWAFCWVAALCFACAAPQTLAADKKPEGAKIEVDGANWVRNRELRLALSRLLGDARGETLDGNAIEDAGVILVSSLAEEGFQRPIVELDMVLEDGAPFEFTFDPTFERALPRPLRARKVRFQLARGVRSYVEKVDFNGLTAIDVDRASRFFRTSATLIATRKTNAFSPSRMNRGGDSLLTELKQLGYAEAEVKVENVQETPEGAVTLRVDVREGPRWVTSDLIYQRDDETITLPEASMWVGKPWSQSVQEDIREAVRQVYYRAGYPDVGVHVVAEAGPATEERGRDAPPRPAHVVATVVPGEHVRMGEVQFEGNRTTREKVLRRRVRLNPGDSLDPVALERARYRISRLGVFESVVLRYEPGDGVVRSPIFNVREAARYETHLLFGYGSYEQLRAGVEHRQKNIFGFAHQSRLELVQSMKSTTGDYRYTVPELFGESLDGTVRLFGLQRQEIAFLRQEFGADITVKRRVARIGGEAGIGYTYQALRNRRNELSTQATDETQINVASMTFGLSGDRRDNPLRPRHGYHWSSQLEAAAPILGGEATYQRLEVSGAYHTSWREGWWVHIGLAHGLITTFGSDDEPLPVNKRFYPGGDNSIRGYQKGEAAPRRETGFIGAKAFTLLNTELERALTPSWSAILFADVLGTAVSLRGYPFDERLYAVGLGIRYQTLIGPIRVEYGRNINPRPNDPSGTWHFSLGYPF